MAKCFQLVGQGTPVRMSDADAFQIVNRESDGQYCPKSVWRKERASAYNTERGSTCLFKLSPTAGLVEVETLHFNAQHRRER
jgi:hypothetical protein